MAGGVSEDAALAVAGGGAAGLFAALIAARQGLAVTVYERLPRPGQKILASGGGRCNLCNLSPLKEWLERFPTEKARFMRHSMHALESGDLRRFLREIGLDTVCPDGWRVFPQTQNSREVLDALLGACRKAGVKILTESPLTGVELSGNRVSAVLCGSGRHECGALLLACGGCSMPELGSDGSGWDIASKLGHEIVRPVPALVPLVTREKWVANYAGISLPGVAVSVYIDGKKRDTQRGDLLFTHKGISGPVILDISGEVAAARAQGQSVSLAVNFLPEISNWKQQMQNWRRECGSQRLGELLARQLPGRLAERFLEISGITPQTTAATLGASEAKELLNLLEGVIFNISSTEGFAKAYLTRGGVNLDEVNAKTMQSRKVGGLFLAGEMLDVDGPCGGYNLHWAFASGRTAALASAQMLQGDAMAKGATRPKPAPTVTRTPG